MNVLGEKRRGWRKARKRGVSPIIATILLVAITVVLAAVLYVLISGLTKGPGGTPLGTAFGFGTPTQQTGPTGGTAGACAATHECYEIAIASASGGLTAGELNLQVKNSLGATVSGVIIYIDSFTTGNYLTGNSNPATTWTATGTLLTSSTPLASTMTIWVDTGGSVAFGAGWTITAFGTGSFSSSVGPQALP